ncbi:hypothetical protein L484_007193 [Morus notabilis]|uniref:Uncharacterized protein n=1 Tax=Morus notabilis TaxID=981085 RepID=W9REM3_9ROSA|nr:hypothetical protein L484_007193 [Morus notabilis]
MKERERVDPNASLLSGKTNFILARGENGSDSTASHACYNARTRNRIPSSSTNDNAPRNRKGLEIGACGPPESVHVDDLCLLAPILKAEHYMAGCGGVSTFRGSVWFTIKKKLRRLLSWLQSLSCRSRQLQKQVVGLYRQINGPVVGKATGNDFPSPSPFPSPLKKRRNQH